MIIKKKKINDFLYINLKKKSISNYLPLTEDIPNYSWLYSVVRSPKLIVNKPMRLTNLL